MFEPALNLLRMSLMLTSSLGQAAPWLLIFPSIFFLTTLFALNFLGDGLRDAFDPRDR